MIIHSPDYPEITQFSDMEISLFSHQKKALYALNKAEQEHCIVSDFPRGGKAKMRTNIGIFADKVGSGKTLTMCSLIHYLEPPSQKFVSPDYCTMLCSLTVEYESLDESNLDSNLIIVPHNLILQWKNTMKNFSSSQAIVKTKKDIENFDFNDIPKTCIVSISQLENFFMKIETTRDTVFNWNRIVIDEPQMLNKIYSSIRYINANFIWFVCATPMDLLGYMHGKPMYLSKFFPRDYSSRTIDYQKCYIIKNVDTLVDESLLIPKYETYYIRCDTPAYYRIIRDHLPSTLALEKLRANDIVGAIETFNCKADTQENIVEKLTHYYQDKIERHKYYNTELLANPFNTAEQRNERIARNNEKIAEYESKIKSITQRIHNVMCPICLDEIQEPKAIT